MIDVSQLHDFHPRDDGLATPLRELLSDDGARSPRVPCGREQFLALLAGVPAMRKIPGVPSPAERGSYAFTTLPECKTPVEIASCKAHLKQLYDISDRRSLLEFCGRDFRCHANYLDFEGFWEGRPAFDPDELRPEARDFFLSARDFAAQFYPIVGHLGFMAWDISETVGLLRLALACGMLGRDDFDSLVNPLLYDAQAFHSWEEYAASLVAGAMYWYFREYADRDPFQGNQPLWLQLVCTLLADKNAWGGGFWYAPERKKNYRFWPAEMKLLLPDWEGPTGCFATDRITVDGCKVGWCYREEPEEGFPDSGWRFFAGDESEAYIADISHTEVCDLNTVCNCDPDVIPLLNAPSRSAFVREDGAFRPEPFDLPED